MTNRSPAPQGHHGPRHALYSRRRSGGAATRWMLVGSRAAVALVSLAVLLAAGAGWAGERSLFGRIITSQALQGEPDSPGGDQNILIMGLDSRLDQHGRALAPELYTALHAGDETAGGYNANVLIVLHVPGDGGSATAISIPRDDYVDLAGCPNGVCRGKIKQAYGLAYQEALTDFQAQAATSATTTHDELAREQLAREAGRRAQITTVRQLLGVPIDHFVEVTLAAFFQIAKVVQPLTVCLNDAASDPYSGADFRAGVQEIDAAEAMAFVRQRRALGDETFTDLDRTRRQQAFIASLIVALRDSGVLTRPSGLRELVDVVEQNVAVDAGFDLGAFIRRAATLADSGLSLYTLPIEEFGVSADGEDINIIDLPTIRAIVGNLISTGSPGGATTAGAGTSPRRAATLDVVNASSYAGLAAAVLDDLPDDGLRAGAASTADELVPTSHIGYGTGARDAAEELATRFNVIATPSSSLQADRVQLTLGTDFPVDDYLTGTIATTPAPVPTVAATATGTRAPVPTELSRMIAAGGIPCVK